jgi:hypothetical protein
MGCIFSNHFRLREAPISTDLIGPKFDGCIFGLRGDRDADSLRRKVLRGGSKPVFPLLSDQDFFREVIISSRGGADVVYEITGVVPLQSTSTSKLKPILWDVVQCTDEAREWL